MLVATPPGLHRLDQDRLWHAWGRDGVLREQLVDDMTPDERWLTLRWLRAHEEQLHAQARRDLTARHSRGDLDADELVAALRDLDALGPRAWLDTSALMRRLDVPRPPRRALLPRWRRLPVTSR